MEELNKATIRTLQVEYHRTLRRKAGYEKFGLSVTIDLPPDTSYDRLGAIYEVFEGNVHKLVQVKSTNKKTVTSSSQDDDRPQVERVSVEEAEELEEGDGE